MYFLLALVIVMQVSSIRVFMLKYGYSMLKCMMHIHKWHIHIQINTQDGLWNVRAGGSKHTRSLYIWVCCFSHI